MKTAILEAGLGDAQKLQVTANSAPPAAIIEHKTSIIIIIKDD